MNLTGTLYCRACGTPRTWCYGADYASGPFPDDSVVVCLQCSHDGFTPRRNEAAFVITAADGFWLTLYDRWFLSLIGIGS